MEEVLRVENLAKSFGGKIVVDNISFSVPRGQILGFLGPNGAGKTTSLRIIMGILNPDSGEIFFNFNGKPSTLDKTKVGYLPEEKGLYEEAKVLPNLIYIGQLKGMEKNSARQKAQKWLERVGLEEYANQKFDKLSRGMKQKVQFIASVLHDPDFLVLDEPFAGLDPVNQNFFMGVVRELQEQGKTILFSAHQMNLVEEICDSIFLINKGKQILSGNLKQIKESYKEYNVSIFFNPEDDPSFLLNHPEIQINKKKVGYLNFTFRGDNNINKLIGQITANLDLKEIQASTPPLHDIFINAVQERGEEVDEDQFV